MDSSENSTTLLGMPTHLDRFSFTGPGLTYADWSLCCPVSTGHSRHPSPTAFFELLLSHSLTGVPFLTSPHPRSRVQNPLSGFAPKQTKESSAWWTTYIVLHPDDHSVPIRKKKIGWNVQPLMSPTASLQRGKTPSKSVLDMTLK